jgi:hypothetical protein
MKPMTSSPRSILSSAVAVAALLAAAPAWAEQVVPPPDDQADPNDAPPTSDPTYDPTYDPSASPAASPAAAARPAEEAKWGRWPQRFIDRPRTLPRGMIEAGGYLDFNRAGVADADPVTSTGLFLAGGYGVSDQLELRVSYGFTIDPSEPKGPLGLAVGFGLKEGQLAVAAAADFTYDLLYETADLAVGPRVRYKLTPDLALYSSRHLVITVISDGAQPASLHLPIGVGYQLNKQLYAFAETEIAQIDLKDSVSLLIFDDYIPFTAGGVFALSKKLELGGLISTDLKNDPFDTMLIELFGRVYL